MRIIAANQLKKWFDAYSLLQEKKKNIFEIPIYFLPNQCIALLYFSIKA